MRNEARHRGMQRSDDDEATRMETLEYRRRQDRFGRPSFDLDILLGLKERQAANTTSNLTTPPLSLLGFPSRDSLASFPRCLGAPHQTLFTISSGHPGLGRPDCCCLLYGCSHYDRLQIELEMQIPQNSCPHHSWPGQISCRQHGEWLSTYLCGLNARSIVLSHLMSRHSDRLDGCQRLVVF